MCAVKLCKFSIAVPAQTLHAAGRAQYGRAQCSSVSNSLQVPLALYSRVAATAHSHTSLQRPCPAA